jgi:Integrase core domain
MHPADLVHRQAQYLPAARIVAIARPSDIASAWSGSSWSHPADLGEAIGLLGEVSCRASEVAKMAGVTRPSPDRLHQTLQLELLNVHGPFASVEDAQAVVDAWRKDYNTRRPHQSLNMAFPAARFTAPAADGLGLRIPAELTRKLQPPAGAEEPEPDDRAAAPPPPGPGSGHGKAVELDRVVPPSGNLWIAGQQVWLGPAMTGRTVRLWAGLSQVHVLLDGHRIKTLPSRLDARDLARLTASGAQPAGPPPLPPAAGDVTEVDRTVNASGNVSLGDHVISAGLPLAGQRITLRLDGPVAHVLAAGVIVRTVACPVSPEGRPRLRGARPGTAQQPQLPEPLVVTRRVSVRGSIMVGGQKIQVGLAHARKTVQVTVGPDTYQVAVETGITVTAARTASRDIRRHKASNYSPAASSPG